MVGSYTRTRNYVSLEEKEDHRHWCPRSQKYAPADVLLQYLQDGWKLEPMATVELHHYTGNRSVEIYHFSLCRGSECQEMPVVATPVVLRLITEEKITILHTNTERQITNTAH